MTAAAAARTARCGPCQLDMEPITVAQTGESAYLCPGCGAWTPRPPLTPTKEPTRA